MDDCVFCGMVLCDKGPVNGGCDCDGGAGLARKSGRHLTQSKSCFYSAWTVTKGGVEVLTILMCAEVSFCFRIKLTVMDPAIAVNRMKANPMLRKNPMSAVSFCGDGKGMLVSLVHGL